MRLLKKALSRTYFLHRRLVIFVPLLHRIKWGTVGQLGVYILESIQYLLVRFGADVIAYSFQVLFQLLSETFQRISRHTLQVTKDFVPVHPFLHFLKVQAGQLVVTFTG